jgi:integrase
VLATAEADELIRQNPCRIRGGGQENASERPMVATSLVLELAETIGPRYRAMVLLAGFAGLRTGETLGLRRCDVDLLHTEVVIRRQAQEIAGRGRVVLAPKSEAGRRTVALPAVVVASLEQHLAARAMPPESPLFTGPEGGALRRATFSRAWRAAVAATGAPAGLRPHDLRHHAATLTARMPGITTKELMARIGHASPRAALIYQHATRDRDRAVASYLDEIVAASSSSPTADVLQLPPLARVVGVWADQPYETAGAR